VSQRIFFVNICDFFHNVCSANKIITRKTIYQFPMTKTVFPKWHQKDLSRWANFLTWTHPSETLECCTLTLLVTPCSQSPSSFHSWGVYTDRWTNKGVPVVDFQMHSLDQWYSTWGTRRHLRRYVRLKNYIYIYILFHAKHWIIRARFRVSHRSAGSTDIRFGSAISLSLSLSPLCSYSVCIIWIIHWQLWGYKIEEKLYLGVCEQKRLNTTALDPLSCICTNYLNKWRSLLWYSATTVGDLFLEAKHRSTRHALNIMINLDHPLMCTVMVWYLWLFWNSLVRSVAEEDRQASTVTLST
jgi:hypothetical protein